MRPALFLGCHWESSTSGKVGKGNDCEPGNLPEAHNSPRLGDGEVLKMIKKNRHVPRVCVCRLGLLALLWLAGSSLAPIGVRADTVVVLVSEASAPELVAAGELFAKREPGHRLVFRSMTQVARLADQQLRVMLEQADALLLVAAFGEDVPRLLTLLAEAPPPVVIPAHADARFTPLARIDGKLAFARMTPGQATARLTHLAEQVLAVERQPALGAPPEQWLAQAFRYRTGRGAENLANLLAFAVADPKARRRLPVPAVGPQVRYLSGDKVGAAPPVVRGPAVAVMDYDYGDQAGDRDVHGAICGALQAQHIACFSVVARWGQPSIAALQALAEAQAKGRLKLQALVMLQDFVVGGGAGASRASSALARLDVPVFKALRVADRSVAAYQVSEDGLPEDSVHYRLAMPELQGIGQPFVVAAAGPTENDARTGLEFNPLQPLPDEVRALVARVLGFARLRGAPNHDKRLALIYYNHPPGRHNIGADNLDVPASLWSILRLLKQAGYDTGTLPESPEALLDLLQRRGVNLPEDQQALAALSKSTPTLPLADYRAYLQGLPAGAVRGVEEGPLGVLEEVVNEALQSGEEDARTLVEAQVRRVLGDVQHLLEGVAHPERGQALTLLEALRSAYSELFAAPEPDLTAITRLGQALRGTGIEGLRGWGPAPGKVMTYGERFVLPGITFGKIFVGPQPPRGWELDEELLHANLAFPPPHQYLAFYEYLRAVHRADAVVHLGRHSTYEFLPGRRTGVGAADYPRVVLGDLPSIYLYIVDGVGEGIQAKRRGQAVIVDHLTPSLRTTPLYDELLELRQLVESYEAGAGVEGHAGVRALAKIRELIVQLKLEDELAASMAKELAVRGIDFAEVDGELLVHEVGHYLTSMQERFMPHGLHVFGRDWSEQAVQRMLTSMAGPGHQPEQVWQKNLQASPGREREVLLGALAGRFVAPGPGNDPVRTPEVLPSGRNFHALDGSVLPTPLGYELGAELAAKALSGNPGAAEGAEAVVLWASDTVRDEGAMVGFGLAMLGVKPIWNSRGIVRGLARVPLRREQVRRDTTFITSGLFRDLYGHMLTWLDQAVLLALDGSAETIARFHPALVPALDATLEPIAALRDPQLGRREGLLDNQLAAHWVEATTALLAAGQAPAQAGPLAAARVFGNAPGGYGAGINRLAERSGAFEGRDELARTYLHRMGHAYGTGRSGAPAHAAFEQVLKRLEHTYLGRASNLYGLLDNNDGFDYLGGLGMAVEATRGTPPQASVVQHADPKQARVTPLQSALMQELRGRHLNPTYLEGLMAHDYAGARTMGNEFLENLWGWQVTSPHLIKGWVWDEVKAVYLDDKHGIGLDSFLAAGQNIHVRTNMQAILLVAAHKGFWKPGESVLQGLSESFARTVIEHGLPGSGHTRPDHPLMAEVRVRLADGQAQAFQAVLDQALGQAARATVSELEQSQDPTAEQVTAAGAPQSQGVEAQVPRFWLWVALSALALAGVGMGYELLRRRR